MKSSKTYRATAKDINLCVRAHLANDEQDAANSIANWYVLGTVDVNGFPQRYFASRAAKVRTTLLVSAGLDFDGVDWSVAK